MQEFNVTLTLEGTKKESGHIRVTDFAKTLKSFVNVVNSSTNPDSKAQKPSLYFRIIALSHNSPATITMEAISKDVRYDERVIVIKNMLENLSRIKDDEDLRTVDYRLLNALSELTLPIGQTMNNLKLSWTDQVVELDSKYKEKVNTIMSKEESYPGTLRGMLEFINLHASNNLFRIYPDVGPPLVSCRFSQELTEVAISAIQKFVVVSGLLIQKQIARFPHEIDVDTIEILPEEENLPTLYDLQGVAPGATGNMLSEDFIRNIRNEQ
jgi:hypothetical protein